MLANERETYQEKQLEELLSQLTLEEKIGMIHGAGLFRTEGVERLGIPPLFMSDGPMGVRAEFADNEWRSVGTTEDFVSYLPCNSAIASTWNRRLAGRAGEVLGEETRGRGKDVILAPGINIKRSPLCGRNFEYMSEDPCLVEELAVPMIEGIQKSDVAACVKHFAANSQETERLWVDTLIDERTLREIYYPGFEAAVKKGGVLSLMGAYNLLNGEHCCTSKKLLNNVLREEWRFDGTVISDWGGVHDTVQAAESALDIEMDVTYDFDKHHMAEPLMEKIRSGELDESLVNEKVRNILRMMQRLNMLGENRKRRKAGCYNTPEHRQSILEAARESVVLLKNEENVLPLAEKSVEKVAVIGQNASAIHSNGGGSAEIKALYEISPLMGIKKLLGGNAKVAYAPGYFIPGKEKRSDINWQADSTRHLTEEEEARAAGEAQMTGAGKATGEADITVDGSREDALRQKYRNDALALAAECDTVIFVGGLNHDYDVEGKDRADMKLPYEQDALIEELLQVKPDMVVVLYGGSPVEMPWKDRAKAILWSYYAGMEGGTAIAEILFGRVNPSGKLAETFIKNVEQCPAHTIGTFGKKDVVEYREGVMVGYRYYDTEQTEVNFCFGHGLSYTDFAYEDIQVEMLGGKKTDETVCRVSATVKNTGTCAGAEAVQLYVAPQASEAQRPIHELRGFEKLELQPGEEQKVAFLLPGRAFAYYDEAATDFVVEPGRYELQIGASSRDIRLRSAIEL
ncbi:MAG: beta-glucosidase [Acetatifactor sp.]